MGRGLPVAIIEWARLKFLGEHGMWPDFCNAFTLSATLRVLWAMTEVGAVSGGGGGGGSSSSECKRCGGGGGRCSRDERGVVELLLLSPLGAWSLRTEDVRRVGGAGFIW